MIILNEEEQTKRCTIKVIVDYIVCVHFQPIQLPIHWTTDEESLLVDDGSVMIADWVSVSSVELMVVAVLYCLEA